jgi:hypothetical protein
MLQRERKKRIRNYNQDNLIRLKVPFFTFRNNKTDPRPRKLQEINELINVHDELSLSAPVGSLDLCNKF